MSDLATKNSTNVRTSPATHPPTRVPPRLRALRGAFKALERVSPSLGARWALRLWCQPPAAGGRRRDDRPGPGRISTLAAAGSPSVVVETWGYGPPVYLLHGWGGWRGQLGAFVEPLVSAGYRAVAVDVPSHGDSASGTAGRGRSTMIEFAQTLAALANAHGAPVAVIAHSMGGAATALAVRDGLSVPRAVFVAPAADPVAQTIRFAEVLGIGPRTYERMLKLLRALAGRPMSEFDVRTLDGRLVPPTLVIHDRDDREVSYEQGLAIAGTWPGTQLLSTSGLGHRRILRDDDVIQAAVDHVRAAA